MLAFVGALVVLLGGAVVGYLVQGFLLTAIIEFGLFVIIFILKPILTPPWWGRSQVRLAMLAIFGAVATGAVALDNYIFPLAAAVYKRLGFAEPTQSTPWHQLAILLVVGAVLVVIAWIWERGQVLPPPPLESPVEEEPFPKADYKQLRDRFCDYMLKVLDR